MKKIALLFLACSCASTQFAAPDLEVVKIENGSNIGGTVVYNPNGLKELVETRRNNAYDRIRRSCRPKTYKIINEETVQPSVRNKKYSGAATAIAGSKVRFVDYKCVDL